MSEQGAARIAWPPGSSEALVSELLTRSAFTGGLGYELVVAEPDRLVLRAHGAGQRQATGDWVGEALEVLCSVAAGTLLLVPGEAAGTMVGAYAASVRTVFHLRASSSAWVEAEVRPVRRGRTQATVEATARDAEGRELVRMLSQHVALPEPVVFSLAALRRQARRE